MKRHESKKSWITNRTKKYIANRDKHYQLSIKTKPNEGYEKYTKKRSEVNMEITKAKRNEGQTKIDHNNSKEFSIFVKKVKGTSNQVTICGVLSVEDFNNYFITAVDTSDTILTHNWKREQAVQSQSIFLVQLLMMKF